MCLEAILVSSSGLHVSSLHSNYCCCIEKLKLKIPWKSLYSAPIVAEVDGLYVIAGPAAGESRALTSATICNTVYMQHASFVNTKDALMYTFAAFKYDAEKSAKEKKERREKQLKRIEEARKRASERKGKALSTRY